MPPRFVEITDMSGETQTAVERWAQTCLLFAETTAATLQEQVNATMEAVRDHVGGSEWQAWNTTVSYMETLFEYARAKTNTTLIIDAPPPSVSWWFASAVVIVCTREFVVRLLVNRHLRRYGIHAHSRN